MIIKNVQYFLIMKFDEIVLCEDREIVTCIYVLHFFLRMYFQGMILYVEVKTEAKVVILSFVF